MRKIIQIVPLISLLAAFFMVYTNTVDDLDLWWHLKTGKAIYETGTVPAEDDFAYTSRLLQKEPQPGGTGSIHAYEEEKSFWTSGFISRNWLSQLIFYLAYRGGGFAAIGVLKSSLFTLSFIILYLAMRRQGSGTVSSLLVLCLVASVGLDFNYSRPQLFSYCLLSCEVFILAEYRRRWKTLYLLPFIFALWANLHGGFVLGMVLLLAVTAAEGISRLLPDALTALKTPGLSGKGPVKLALASLASFGATLMSPAGISTYLFPLMLRGSLFAGAEEYHRPMFYEYHVFWLMLVLLGTGVLFLLVRKGLDLSNLFLCAVLVIPALTSNKYIMYFALGCSVLLARSISSAGAVMAEWLRGRTVPSAAGLKSRPSLLLALISLVALIQFIRTVPVLQFDLREGRYPAGAASFIQDSRLPGNMFNLFNWGGYLLWHLYPEYRVFIYGRAVNEKALLHYNWIVNAAQGTGAGPDRQLWKDLLDGYDVNFIVTSALSSSGNLIPLVDRLYQDKGWELVYLDGTSLIFLRASENNQQLLSRHSLSRERLYEEIIMEGLRGIAETPAAWGYYETLGFVYMKQNRFQEALAMFEKYLSMNPGNKNVRDSYELLKRYLETYSRTDNKSPSERCMFSRASIEPLHA